MANTILAAAFLCGRSRWEINFVSLVCVVPVLFLFVIVDKPIAGVYSLSAKDLAVQLYSRNVPPEQTSVYHGMGRSLRYGLNFYLRREAADIAPRTHVEGFVVGWRLTV